MLQYDIGYFYMFQSTRDIIKDSILNNIVQN